MRTPPLYFALQNAGEEFKSNPPFITDLIISFYCFCFNPLALWALPLYSLTETQGERRVNSITFTEGIFNPSVLTDTSPIFCGVKHPVRLRGTAGERLGVAYFSSFLDTRGMRIDVYNCRTAATVSNIIQSGSSLNMKYEEATKKREENVSMW